MKLRYLATISQGVHFRSGVEPRDDGNLFLIQMRNLKDDAVSLKDAVRIKHPKPKAGYRAEPGDILFRSRGQKHTAAIYEGKADQAMVAAPLLVVRPNTEKVVPHYLLRWLTQPRSQHYFATYAEGSAVHTVSKLCLENLEVSLPSLDRQHSLVAYFALVERENALLKSIQRLRFKHAQSVFMHLAETGSDIDNKNLEAATTASLPPQPILDN